MQHDPFRRSNNFCLRYSYTVLQRRVQVCTSTAIADNLNCELRFCSLLFAAFFLVGASALPRALMLGSVRSVCTRGQQKSGRLYGLARKCGEKF